MTAGKISDRVGVQQMFGWAGLSFLVLLAILFVLTKNSKMFQKRLKLA
jgi:uncharacterized membrane protein YjfL (UPF0719 family)